MSIELVEPWLISIWPGMGSVALTAGTYLTASLGAEKLGPLEAAGFFDLERVEIRDGVASLVTGPACDFYGWKAPQGGRDLLFFVGESQPSQHGYEFCRHLLEAAQRFGVKRVFTFAAMATQIHPSAEPRVFAAVNDAKLLRELRSTQVQILREGQISGLNGVMLAAAATQKLEAICLLGEMPFFAVAVPNPKASLRVLEVFSNLADLEIDLRELGQQATQMERDLIQLMERMNQSMQGMQSVESEPAPESSGAEPKTPENEEVKLSREDRRRVDDLFEKAQKDRSHAMKLKRELDRLGVFKRYEDRFLDLFRRGE